MECNSCGQGYPTHYLKDGACPICRDAEKLANAHDKIAELEAKIARQRKWNREQEERIDYMTRKLNEAGKQLVRRCAEVERLKRKDENIMDFLGVIHKVADERGSVSLESMEQLYTVHMFSCL